MGHRVPEGVDRELRDDCALENRLPHAEAGRGVDLRHPAGQPAGNVLAFRSAPDIRQPEMLRAATACRAAHGDSRK